MRRALGIGLACAATVMALSLRGDAQGLVPGGEIFGGYSYLRSNTGAGFNANGWEGSLTGNFNRFFGLEVDLADHYNSPPVNAGFSSDFSFLFGPHFALRGNPKVTPFAHVLAGGTRGTQTPLLFLPCPVGIACQPSLAEQHETAFTTAVGGGIDVKAARFVWIRVIQADYLREQFTNNPQNDVRLSFGVVLRFSR